MPPHWEYNVQNAPGYKKKWGTNLVWKWQHGLHALDFATSFINFEKDITMDIITCRALYLDPSDGCRDFFCQVTKGYWNKVQEQFHFKIHPNDKWFNSQGKVVYINVFNLEKLPKGLQESIKTNIQFHGRPSYEATQDCLFNQISPHTFQLLQGLKSFRGLQEILAQDSKTITYGAPRQLTMQWGEGNSKGNVSD
jgi:hypothetical protein